MNRCDVAMEKIMTLVDTYILQKNNIDSSFEEERLRDEVKREISDVLDDFATESFRDGEYNESFWRRQTP